MTTDAAATAHRALAALADRGVPPAARATALRALAGTLRAHALRDAALLARTATALVAALPAPTTPLAPCAHALAAALLDPATLHALRHSSVTSAQPPSTSSSSSGTASTPIPLVDRAAGLLVRAAARTLAQPATLAAVLRALSAALAADRAVAARHALAVLPLAADALRAPEPVSPQTATPLWRAQVQALFCVRHCAPAAPGAAMQAWPRLLGAPRAPLLTCLAAHPPRRAAAAADTLAALVVAARPFLAVASRENNSNGRNNSHAGYTPLSASVAAALCSAYHAVARALGVFGGCSRNSNSNRACTVRLCRCLQVLASAAPPARLDAALAAEGVTALLPLLTHDPRSAAARDAAAALAAAQPPAPPLARLLASSSGAHWLDALAASLEQPYPRPSSSHSPRGHPKWEDNQDDDGEDEEDEDDREEEGNEEEETVETEAETAAGVRALFAVAQTYGDAAVPKERLARAAQGVLTAATTASARTPALVRTVCAAAARLSSPALAAVWRTCFPTLLSELNRHPQTAEADNTAEAVLALCAHLDSTCLHVLDELDGDGATRLVDAVLAAASTEPCAQRAAFSAAALFLGHNDYWTAHPAAVARLVHAALAAAPTPACRSAALSCLATAGRYTPLFDRDICTALCEAFISATSSSSTATSDATKEQWTSTALRGIAAVCAARGAPTAATEAAFEGCVLAGLDAHTSKTQWNACIAARAVFASASTDTSTPAHAALAHALVFRVLAHTDSCKLRVHAATALQALRTRDALAECFPRALTALAAAFCRAAADDAYSPAALRYRPALLTSVCFLFLFPTIVVHITFTLIGDHSCWRPSAASRTCVTTPAAPTATPCAMPSACSTTVVRFSNVLLMMMVHTPLRTSIP